MAINKNHEFEDLNGVKCAIVERNASQQRVDFLKPLLEHNKFTVVVVASPPPKAAAAAAAAAVPAAVPAPTGEAVATAPETPAAATTFTIGVTDVSFNPVNAIFGRLLKTQDGRVVTLAYWQQEEKVSNDEKPYFAKRPNKL